MAFRMAFVDALRALEGVPTQFLPSSGDLGDEANETAETLQYEGVSARVALREYLVALYLQPEARTMRSSSDLLQLVPGRDRQRS
jgi:hypothetical protein